MEMWEWPWIYLVEPERLCGAASDFGADNAAK